MPGAHTTFIYRGIVSAGLLPASVWRWLRDLSTRVRPGVVRGTSGKFPCTRHLLRAQTSSRHIKNGHAGLFGGLRLPGGVYLSC